MTGKSSREFNKNKYKVKEEKCFTQKQDEEKAG